MKNNLYESEWINVDGNKIHVTAIVYPNVKLGKGNVIGSHTVIGSPGEIRGKNHVSTFVNADFFDIFPFI